MKRYIDRMLVAIVVLGTVAVQFMGQQTPPQNIQAQPTITITTGSATSQTTNSLGAHQASVSLRFGTVTGTYTTCNVQAYTSADGTNYLTIGDAVDVTVSNSTTNSWKITEDTAHTASTTAASAFGSNTRFVFACSGGYGTTAPATLRVTYTPFAVDEVNATVTGSVSVTGTVATNLTQVSGTTIITNDGAPVVSFGTTANPINISQVGGSTVSTVASGVIKVGIVDSNGNAITNADVVSTRASSVTAIYQNKGLVGTTVTAINVSAVVVDYIYCINPHTTVTSYLHVFNTTAPSVTLSSSTPTLVFAVFPQGAGRAEAGPNLGMPFSNGVAIVNVAGTAGNSGNPSSGLVCNITYKM